MQLITGYWASATLGSGVTYSVFTHIDRGHRTVKEIAQEAGISERGAQALLDGIVGLGLVRIDNGHYINSEEATYFLVEGKPTYVGGFAKMAFMKSSGFDTWAKLPMAVKTGAPVEEPIEDDSFWQDLVLAIAPMAMPLAQTVQQRLDFARMGSASVLDVGGGSGVYSAVLLSANPEATATQVDWPSVNRIARDFTARFGVGSDRFKTVDGDFHDVDFGTSAHDVVIYSNIAHQETPEDNVAIFRKIRRALKPGGTLIISDFVVNDERSGPPFPLLFHQMMLLTTKGGATFREADYRAWLSQTEFKDISFEPTPTPATLICAR